MAVLYAPNDDDPSFFLNFFDHLNDFKCDEIIIGGDFNLVLVLDIDKKGGLAKTHTESVKTLKDFCAQYDLLDAWRILKKKSFVANRIAHFNPSGFRNFPGYTIMRKAILCCVSFACNKMQNQIFELPLRSKKVFFIYGFQTGKKALARFKEHQVSECHKIAIDYETNLSRTCGIVWEMPVRSSKKDNGV